MIALCDGFAARLLEAGWEAARDEPWGHARLANGVPVDATLSRLLTNARADGLDLGDPFSEEGTALLMEWATGPAPVGAASGVTRYMLELHRSRDDLGGAFPLLDGEDGVDYVRWVIEHGADEEGIHEALLPARQLPGADGARVPFAVNVAGYLAGGLGLGEAARGYVRALQSAGVPVRTESVDPPLPPAQRAFGVPAAQKRLRYAELEASLDCPLNLVCVNAPELPGFAQRVGEEFFDGRKTVGVWAWETSFIPPAVGRGVRPARRGVDLLDVRRQCPRAAGARCPSWPCRCRCPLRPRSPAGSSSSSATRSRSCSRSTSSRPSSARTRWAWWRRSSAPSGPGRARSSS